MPDIAAVPAAEPGTTSALASAVPAGPGRSPALARRRVGVLLVNLGTPDAPRTPEVRRYLREFLSDPRVIDLPAALRLLLVHGIIAPFRSPRSARAYRKIWTPRGSPLLVHGRDLRDAVAERLPGVPVVLAMRYGRPSIAQGLEQLQEAGVDEIVVAPLFPHYAASSYGSAVAKVYAEAERRWNTPFVRVLPPYYDAPEFIAAFAAVGQPVLADLQPDHVVFSFHGVPERHCRKSDPTGAHCLPPEQAAPVAVAKVRLPTAPAAGGPPAYGACCDVLVDANRNCYRAQCVATAKQLAARLGLADGGWSISFQSRLGRDPWIRPYTDHHLLELAAAGHKRVAVYCPAFVADCLETLEEIGVEAKHEFEAAGGERLALVPSLNASAAWADGLCALIAPHLGRPSAAPVPATASERGLAAPPTTTAAATATAME